MLGRRRRTLTTWFVEEGGGMLPAYPWSQRPDDHPLTVDEVCEALVHSEGDIRSAADRLRVGTLILRKFIERSSRARAVIREMALLLADEAQQTLREALRDEDSRRRDWAIRFILNSRNAQSLGWSSTSDAADALSRPSVTINLPAVSWADGTPLTSPSAPPPRLIDVTPSSSPKASDGE
jgi:hypothetical protein